MSNLNKTLKKASKANLILIIGLFLLIFGAGHSYAASWTEPSEPPPGGNIAAPINTTIQPQTKRGDLSIGTEANFASTPPKLATFSVWGTVCWNGTDLPHCKSNWSEALGSYVSLQNDWVNKLADLGVAYVKPQTVEQSAAITGEGILSSGQWNAGVYGITSDTQGKANQYGVLGEAQAFSTLSRAVVGDASGSASYAGHFQGNVKIDGDSDIPGNLYLGDRSYAVKLCLYGQGTTVSEWCRDKWPDATMLWRSTGSVTYLEDYFYSKMAVGGANIAEANFLTTPKWISGGGVILGNPRVSGFDIKYSCGDKVCNNNETIATCPSDCLGIFE